MSDADHHLDDRDVTSCLVDLSEISKYITGNKGKVSRNSLHDWSEAVVGWRKSIEVTLTSPNIGNVKKKKNVERSVTDIHFGNAYCNQNQGDEYWSNSSTFNEHRPSVRCVGDDFEAFPIPPWKSNIEQGTCRYVHDNGSYRTLKFMYDDRKDWYTMRKKKPEKVSTTWHHTCKRMQREMKRQLKKDIATAEKEREKHSGSKTGQRISTNSFEFTSVEDTHTSTTTLSSDENKAEYERNSPQKLDMFTSRDRPNVDTYVSETELKPPIFEHSTKPLHKKDNRVRSTNSDGAVNQVKKMRTIPESEPVTPIPHYSLPTGSQMLKSASDLFIENFSSRISALEDEIKRDSKWLRKNENELTKIQNSRNKHRESHRCTFKDSSNIAPRAPVRTEPLTSDIFSVKPMAQKELKPIEKIKSYTNKTNNVNQSGDYVQNETCGTFPNKNNYNTYINGINYNSELDRGLNSSKASADISKQALLTTLTGTKINTQSNKRTSKGFSSPSTITICDTSSNGATANQHLNEQHGDTLKQIPFVLEKKTERKGALQSIPALLPEISGKRLEPASVSHRLL